MPLLILLLILSLPVVELAILIDIGGEIGALPAVGLCILTAAVGLSIVRMQGMRVFQDMQAATRTGEPVGASLVHGFFLAIAGVFLFIPGFMTDFVGALLLIPPLRLALGRLGMARFVARGNMRSHTQSTIIIDGEYHEEPQSQKDKSELADNTDTSDKPKN